MAKLNISRGYFTISEAADKLRCDEESIWYCLENDQLVAVIPAEFEAPTYGGFEYILLPPEGVRRIRAGTHFEVEWVRPYGQGTARVISKIENIRVLSAFGLDALDAGDKPMTSTERTTLLIIIAALCNHAGINHQEKGASGKIARMTEEIGATVTNETILNTALKKIPDAIETRIK